MIIPLAITNLWFSDFFFRVFQPWSQYANYPYQYTITELCYASLSKEGLVYNYSYENEFNLHVKAILFHMKGGHRDRLKVIQKWPISTHCFELHIEVDHCQDNFPLVINSSIGHLQYINILRWIWGFRVKIANLLSFFCLTIPKRDLHT